MGPHVPPGGQPVPRRVPRLEPASGTQHTLADGVAGVASGCTNQQGNARERCQRGTSVTMTRELLSAQAYGELAERESLESLPWQSTVERRRVRRDLTEPAHQPVGPDRAPAAEVTGRPDADGRRLEGRTRRFAELESLIIVKERALRRLIWDVPEDDVRLRVKVAEKDARRRGQFAESARLALVRRSGTRNRRSEAPAVAPALPAATREPRPQHRRAIFIPLARSFMRA